MNISPIQKYDNTNFKSGLTKGFVQMEKTVQPEKIKEYFINSSYKDVLDFEHNLDFKNNKTYALACKLCANIFIQLKKRLNYGGICTQNAVFPTGLYVFDADELTNETKREQKDTFFTIISDANNIFQDNRLVKRNTVLFDNNMFGSLEDINSRMDYYKRVNYISTGHFLHPFVHEWLHALQGKIIHSYTNDLRYGNYEATAKQHYLKKVCKWENEIVADVLGRYAATQNDQTMQYTEIFAEAWTKFICDSLNDECTGFKKDPVDELMKTLKDFRRILKKVSAVKPLSAIDCKSYQIFINWCSNIKNPKDMISWNKEWD